MRRILAAPVTLIYGDDDWSRVPERDNLGSDRRRALRDAQGPPATSRPSRTPAQGCAKIMLASLALGEGRAQYAPSALSPRRCRRPPRHCALETAGFRRCRHALLRSWRAGASPVHGFVHALSLAELTRPRPLQRGGYRDVRSRPPARARTGRPSAASRRTCSRTTAPSTAHLPAPVWPPTPCRRSKLGAIVLALRQRSRLGEVCGVDLQVRIGNGRAGRHG